MIAAVTLAAAVAHLGRAGAELSGTSGDVVKVVAPASAVENTYESDTEVRAFDERQDVTLVSPLAVDITSAGTYDEVGDLTAGIIPSGTVVSSHLLHADPVGAPEPTAPVSYTGAMSFDGEILGVIVRNTAQDPNLRESDVLGAPGTLYPVSLGGRGLEFSASGGDLVVADDEHSLSVRLTMHRFDQIRVITAGRPFTSTTAPPTTTTAAPTTTTTVPVISAATVAPTTTTTAPLPQPQVLGATLPRTGTTVHQLVLLGLVTLVLGAAALGFGRRSA